MPEHSGWTWPTKGPASPFFNKVIIEARLRSDVYTKSRWGKRNERFTWFWFEFRDIWRKGIGETMWTDPWRMKVMIWGKAGEVMLWGVEKNDLIHAEGFFTMSKDQVGHFIPALLAKECYVRKDVRPAAWGALAARSKARKRFGGAPVTDRMLREEERDKLIKKGLIKPSPGDLARIPDSVPEEDFSDYDFGI